MNRISPAFLYVTTFAVLTSPAFAGDQPMRSAGVTISDPASCWIHGQSSHCHPAEIADMIGGQQNPVTFNNRDRMRLNIDPSFDVTWHGIRGLTWGEQQARKIRMKVFDSGPQDTGERADPSTHHIGIATQVTHTKVTDAGDHFTYDWADFDDRAEYNKTVLNAEVNAFGFPIQKAKILFDPRSWGRTDMASFLPVNWSRYEQLVRDTVTHVKGVYGAGKVYLLPLGEIEFGGWQGAFDPARFDHPDDVIKGRVNAHNDRRKALLVVADAAIAYAHTYKAVKQADPLAKVAGPYSAGTSYIDRVGKIHTATPATSGISDFLDAIKTYQAKNPDDNVKLEALEFQHYWFEGEQKNLTDSLDLLTADLIRDGFCADKLDCANTIDIGIVGFNRDFLYDRATVDVPQPDGSIKTVPHAGFCCTNPKIPRPVDPINRQSFLVGNMMREVAPKDGIRRLARLGVWPIDSDQSGFGFSALYYPEFYGFIETTWTDPSGVIWQPEVTVKDRFLAPSFAAMQMLVAMQTDDAIIRTASSDAQVWTLATRAAGGRRLRLLLTNYADTPAHVTPIVPKGPIVGSARFLKIQRVDRDHSFDGKGLESGTAQTVSIGPNGRLSAIALPAYGTALLTICTSGACS